MSFRSTWSQVATADQDASSGSVHAPTSVALNCLFAIATSDVRIWTSASLGLVRLETQNAGRGGFSTVEVGQTADKNLVAVKRSITNSTTLALEEKDAFDRKLNQLCLELRILTSKTLRRHDNIVNILGVCIDQRSGLPSLSLVLEYSEIGTLHAFLTNKQREVAIDYRDCAVQVASGLEALHALGVCHGDVKAVNVLVFEEGDKLLFKLSDFGQCVVMVRDGSTEHVTIPNGTLIYNAPEVRTGAALQWPTFTIGDAIRTDIFSFGLLFWEILNDGNFFFERTWSGSEIEDMFEYLNQLPQDTLLHRSLAFLKEKNLDGDAVDQFSAVLRGTLRDLPADRQSIGSLKTILSGNETLPYPPGSEGQTGTKSEALTSWTFQNTLYELFELGLGGGILIDGLPRAIQELVLSELKTLAENPHLPEASRAHAAMTISECYTVGYGVSIDCKEIVHWLSQAALGGLYKAGRWYSRVCDALATPANAHNSPRGSLKQLDEQLAALPCELYLSARIRRYAALNWKSQSEEITRQSLVEGPETFSHGNALFNPWNLEALTTLHLAALTGNINGIIHNLQSDVDEPLSIQGLSPLHYACMGGHLSSVRLLVERGASVVATSYSGITPLHLCVFFADEDILRVVELLLKQGAAPEAKTEVILWEEHDLRLLGTPLNWAVTTRNVGLVRALLPHTKDRTGVHTALKHFFWDILDDLLREIDDDERNMHDFWNFINVSRPFSHWLAHGTERFSSIDRTMQICQKHDMPWIEMVEGYTPLMNIVNYAKTEEDFYIIQRMASFIPSTVVKQRNVNGYTALFYAIICAKHNSMWKGPIEALVNHYSVAELEETVADTAPYLHRAVTSDSIVGARVLLEKGVDVDQPTPDRYASTPLHLCIEIQLSTEMHALLVEFGADVTRQNGDSMAQALQAISVQSNSLDQVLDQEISDETYILLLHSMLNHSMGLREEHRKDAHEVFRHVLKRPETARLIDMCDANGLTLLHRAAQHLHLENVELLLEAGASPAIGTFISGKTFYPLQTAAAAGRLFVGRDMSTGDGSLSRDVSSAMEICGRLLDWHGARGDEAFRGITRLHLASHMGIEPEVRRLLALQKDVGGKGRWPSLMNEVTPSEIAIAVLEEDIAASGEELMKPVGYDTWEERAQNRGPVRFDAEIVMRNMAAVHNLIISHGKH